MPLLSIITPSYLPVREQILEAYDSVRAQELPPGWELEWVVQEDGETGVVGEILPADPRVKIGTGRRSGVAPTRNLALARSKGTLIKNLDQDDILTPGALARDLEVLTSDPTVQWTTSRVLDLMPDGTTVGFDGDPPAGRLEPGFVLDYWRGHDYRLPVHPTTICIRRESALALGGWMAVPASEDTGLLIAASVVGVGYFRREVGLLYRKWPGQATARAGHHAAEERRLRMRLIDQRAEAIKALPAFRGERSATLCNIEGA
ncbi:glycosyltransferase family 2 protein [Nonomuraea longicatena]|uniref:Glycosyltransferase family 2 protein n=1 Tax=Nonomuraea longicatena TaxID=83682 RepID=A0ABP4BAS7_9ACTN